jgi:FtsH-binding integral membrane protein
LVFWLSFGINRLSASAAQTLFFVYAGLLGLSLATIFLAFTATSITRVFFISAASFGALSLWGYTTQRDLSGFGSFLIMGLIGVVIASLVNIFLRSSGLDWVISVVGVLVFAGLTAWDTQKIKEMYDPMDDGTLAGRKAVMGALSLYLDFINLFLMMLRLFGTGGETEHDPDNRASATSRGFFLSANFFEPHDGLHRTSCRIARLDRHHADLWGRGDARHRVIRDRPARRSRNDAPLSGAAGQRLSVSGRRN